MRRAALAALAVAVAATAFAGSAGAVERENQIGLELGVPMLVYGSNKSVATGASAGVHYTYGLTDAFNFVADADSGVLFAGVKNPATLTHADLGLAYVLDVLRWVPWGAAEVGGYGITGSSVGVGGGTFLPGAALAVGLDYRFDRSWAAGFVVREHLFFTNLSLFPSLTEGFLRVGYTWGW